MKFNTLKFIGFRNDDGQTILKSLASLREDERIFRDRIE